MTSTPKALSPIHLDGTTLEGGGQLLRVALCFSSLTRRPIRITEIRGNRSGGGGLNPQHLTSIQWLGKASHAETTGAELKSKEITFAPSNTIEHIHRMLDVGHVRIEQKTPGSINLVLQAILPYILFSGLESPIHVRIDGGTNVTNSPSTEYVAQVLIPTLELIGIPHIDVQIHSQGWSQGIVTVGSVTYTITPLKAGLPGFRLVDRGHIANIRATIVAPKGTERQFREELDVMFDRRRPRFFDSGNDENHELEVTFEDSQYDKRYYLLLVATSSTGMKLGRDWLYDRRFRAGKTEQIIPDIVRGVSDDLLAEIEHGGCVDEYSRDQLVVFQALARGESRVYGGKRNGVLMKPSLHTMTAQWVAKEILGVQFDDEGGCEGVGYLPSNVGKKDILGDDIAKDLER